MLCSHGCCAHSTHFQDAADSAVGSHILLQCTEHAWLSCQNDKRAKVHLFGHIKSNTNDMLSQGVCGGLEEISSEQNACYFILRAAVALLFHSMELPGPQFIRFGFIRFIRS